MFQQIILPKFNNKLEEQLINLFHSSNLPLHYQKTLRFCFGVFEFPKNTRVNQPQHKCRGFFLGLIEQGINNFKIGGGENIGFALESNYIKEITNKISQRELNITLI